MENIIVFHHSNVKGSNVKVATPKILADGFYKDFGYGFYCTKPEKKAKRWALTKKGASVVSSYEYSINESLKILSFEKMTDEWFDFIADCRRGVEHSYDIVEGPMADDQIWNFVEWFANGKISKAAFFELAKFNHPTHQIAFCTEEALRSIRFTGSYGL